MENSLTHNPDCFNGDYVCFYEYSAHVENPIGCLPAYTNMDNLEEITEVQDRFKKYLDTVTGRIIDCEVYYNEMMKCHIGEGGEG